MESTPLPIIASITRLVSKITDRISGDRSEYPLLVACVVSEALKHCGVHSNVFYGQAAWIEVMENQNLMWVGCWGSNTHFWVTTQFGEVVDLNTSVSYRKKSHHNPDHQPQFSPPMLWAKEVPAFYRYLPEGIAEVELDAERDRRWFELCLSEVIEKLGDLRALVNTPAEDLDFADEAILGPERRILDDAAKTFQYYDRAIMIHGLPEKPF